MDLISVIVPAYNVEKYLARCLDSICSQTYRDIEIIVIDDGSCDGTPGICDEYGSSDSRIRVVHKQNEGVAAARNTALDMATGSKVAFADADDIYEPDMLEKMNEAMLQFEADMVVCGYYEEYTDRTDRHGIDKGKVVYNREEAYGDFFRMAGHIGSGCWNKLIKSDAIGEIRFKKYSMGEDVEWICRVLDNCQKVVCLDYYGYHYIHREDSASRKRFSAANLELLYVSDEMLGYIREKHPELVKKMYGFHAAWYSAQIQVLYWHDNRHLFVEEKKYIKDRIRANLSEYALNPYVTKLDKVYILSYFLGCGRLVFGFCDHLRNRRTGIEGQH